MFENIRVKYTKHKWEMPGADASAVVHYNKRTEEPTHIWFRLVNDVSDSVWWGKLGAEDTLYDILESVNTARWTIVVEALRRAGLEESVKRSHGRNSAGAVW